MPRPKIMVYGSCVTRDPIEPWVKDGSIDLVYYLSKSSTAAQATEKTKFNLPLPEGVDFASRMVKHDINKDARDLISKGNFDWIIFDFIDDRLPLIELDGGRYTISRFFEDLYHKRLKEAWHPKPLTLAAHRNEYLNIFRGFFTDLKFRGLTENKVILHKAWWSRTVQSSNGKTALADESVRQSAHEQNQTLKLSYKIFEELFPGCKKIEVPKPKVVADSGHKWGADPYHYIEDYNEFFRDAMWRIVGDIKPTTPQYPVTTTRIIAQFDTEKAFKNPDATFFPQNSRMEKGKSLYYGVQDRRNPFCEAFGINLPYLTHHKEHVAKFKDTGVVFDENDVPKNLFRWGGPYRYSVTIGHHGLSCLSRYVTAGDIGEAKSAISVAKWLIENQSPDGAWRILFDHDWFPGRCDVIGAPWVSAMGQGLCISLLSRVCYLMDNGKLASTIDLARDDILRSARSAVRPFFLPTEHGGVRSLLFGKFIFFEEYPTRPSSFVLNGFIYSLLGLHDLWSLTGDAEPKHLYDEGIKSLHECLSLYDLGRATAYDLTHITSRNHMPNIARPSYHYIHVQLLSVLNLLEPGTFEEFLDRWWKYYNGWGARTN